MPPRIQNSVTNSLTSCIPSSSTSILCCARKDALQTKRIVSQSQCLSRRPFSSSRIAQTRLRFTMFNWLLGEGASLKHHIPGDTNYVTDLKERMNPRGGSNRSRSDGADGEDNSASSKRPFPLNSSFVSSPILGEDLRNEIYKRVVKQNKSVRTVSVELQVDMRRIGAAVRLVELEKRMEKEKKSMAIPYARAVHEMVPTTPLAEGGQRQPIHEPINELPVHRLTQPQIFYPVSESRQFTRVDAGRVFSGAPALETDEEKTLTVQSLIKPGTKRIEKVGKGDDEQHVLLPADARIPHPQLIELERDFIAKPHEPKERWEKYHERIQKSDALAQKRKADAKKRAEERTIRIEPENSRFEFRFNDVVVSKETTGPDGRGHSAPGRRYGVPTYDRKKGQVKIPTKVEV